MTRRRALLFAALALLLLTGAPSCRSHRVVQTASAEEAAVQAVRVLASDSLRLVAVVSVDRPRLTLSADSGLALEGDRAVARVVARSGNSRSVERTDSAARSASRTYTDADARIERPRLWPLVLGLLVIALSWLGIRARR